MSKRRIGELEPDELVSTLLISEIAAMPISDANIPLFNSVIPIIFIVALEVVLAALKNRSRRAKNLIEGKPSYIIYKGKLFPEALNQNRISVNEVLSEMRSQGIGSLSDVSLGILEANGKLSLIKQGEHVSHNLIIDGEIHPAELKLAKKDGEWLKRELDARNLVTEDILLLSLDENGSIHIVGRES